MTRRRAGVRERESVACPSALINTQVMDVEEDILLLLSGCFEWPLAHLANGCKLSGEREWEIKSERERLESHMKV